MDINQELLRRYHLGTCSEEEVKLVEHWLGSEEAMVSFPVYGDLDKIQEQSWLEMQQ